MPTEEEVVPSIRCFRYAAKHGWNDWEPQRYNTVMAAHLFFLEFEIELIIPLLFLLIFCLLFFLIILQDIL